MAELFRAETGEGRTMTAKEYLQQIRKADRTIENKLSEISSLRVLAESVTSSWKEDVVQSSGSGDKLGDTVNRIIDLERELNADIDRLIDLKREVMKVIDQIEEPYCDILYKRYFRYMRWEEIALEMHYTYQWVCVLHGKALLMVKELIEIDKKL